MADSFPYLAKSILRYKSPHKTDLSFEKGETIRVTGPSSEDEEWLVGETLDGSRTGGFPKEFVEIVPEESPVPPPAPSEPIPASEKEDSIAHAEETAAPPEEETTEEAVTEAPPPPPVATPTTPATTAIPAVPPIQTRSPPPDAASSLPRTGATEDEPAKLSFKEKMAAFNRQAGAGPPPIKPKPAGAGAPGTWSWKQKQAQAQASTAPAPAPAPAPASAPSAPETAQTPKSTGTPATPAASAEGQSHTESSERAKAMSASDAKEAISKGGSLKERMAALQGAGAFGSQAGTPKSPPAVAAKPKVWKRPEPVAAAENGEAQHPAMGLPPPPIARTLSGHESAGGGDSEEAPAADQQEAGPEAAAEQDEEAKEKARRAAIAARMARLGGRGMMGGMMGVAGPKPGAPGAEAREESLPTEALETEDKSEEAQASESTQAKEAEVALSATSEKHQETVVDATSPPTTIKLPSIPRRAAAPKRRGPARAASQTSATSASATNEDGEIPVVLNEYETPIPETPEQAEERKKLEEMGQGPNAAAGATAAGIALDSADKGEGQKETEISEAGEHPVSQGNQNAEETPSKEPEDKKAAPHSPVVSHNPAEADPEDLGQPSANMEDSSDEKAREEVSAPPPPSRRLVPPTDDSEQEEDDDEWDAPAPPPAPHRPTQATAQQPTAATQLLGLPKDEIELKHEAEASEKADSSVAAETGVTTAFEDFDDQDDEVEEEEEGPPSPPPTRAEAAIDEVGPPPPIQPRSVSLGKPMGPRPMPASPSRDTSVSGTTSGLQSGAETPSVATGGASQETPDEAAQRPPSGVSDTAVAKPADNAAAAIATEIEAAPVDEEAERRKGIAARMAKLGGIKFGAPPPVRKPTAEATPAPVAEQARQASSSDVHAAESPSGKEAAQVAPTPTDGQIAQDDEDESEEAATRRRQATLARLRAGGALGFGMFNRSQKDEAGSETQEPQVGIDERGLEQDQPETIPAAAEPAVEEEEEEEEDAAPPPPPPARTRPSVDTGRARDLHSVPEAEAVSGSPAVTGSPASVKRQTSISSTSARSDVPPSALRRQSSSRSASGRPEVAQPPVRRPSNPRTAPEPLPTSPILQDSGNPLMEEPAVMMMMQGDEGRSGQATSIEADEDEAPPPPPPPRIRGQSLDTGRPGPQRTPSTASRSSTMGQGEHPMSPVPPSPVTRTSMSQNRPNFNELRDAAASYGARVHQAAHRLADQAKKQTLGDGDARALVWQAMSAAGLDANVTLGTLVLEQNGASVVRRLDEPRPGDIVVLQDVKLKGKKGLHSYTQSAGSVEIPVFGVCSEFEHKKNKVKVWQIEQGHADSASYRLDDLKSGNAKIYRPMP